MLEDSRVADTEVDAVLLHARRDVHALDGYLHGEERLAIDDRSENDVVGLALDATGEHVYLAVAARIAERGAQEEAIELCLGERIRTLVLDRGSASRSRGEPGRA